MYKDSKIFAICQWRALTLVCINHDFILKSEVDLLPVYIERKDKVLCSAKNILVYLQNFGSFFFLCLLEYFLKLIMGG